MQKPRPKIFLFLIFLKATIKIIITFNDTKDIQPIKSLKMHLTLSNIRHTCDNFIIIIVFAAVCRCYVNKINGCDESMC